MKINVNTKTIIAKDKPENKPQTTSIQKQNVPFRRSFFSKFLQVCIEDIEKKFSPFRKQKRWDGRVPKIEPRYK